MKWTENLNQTFNKLFIGKDSWLPQMWKCTIFSAIKSLKEHFAPMQLAFQYHIQNICVTPIHSYHFTMLNSGAYTQCHNGKSTNPIPWLSNTSIYMNQARMHNSATTSVVPISTAETMYSTKLFWSLWQVDNCPFDEFDSYRTVYAA